MAAPIALLGPQRQVTTAGQVMDALQPSGRIGAILAGWQEREAEDRELNDVFSGRTVNLGLYGRSDRVWRADPELRRDHRALQRRLRTLRESYVTRLAHLMEAWLRLEDLPGEDAVLAPERDAAFESIRALDRAHLSRIAELRDEFEERIRPAERDAVVRERTELAALLADCAGVAIAGGHVAVLGNRLRLFGLGPLLAGKPIVAWSAGAMVLTDRVVLFHDSPPQGMGNAEAFDRGVGVVRDVVVLPHAASRLMLGNPGRVRRLASRFAPAACVALDAGDGVIVEGGAWRPLVSHGVHGVRSLEPDGRVLEVAA